MSAFVVQGSDEFRSRGESRLMKLGLRIEQKGVADDKERKNERNSIRSDRMEMS